jgi:hypothetical protein
LRAPKPGFTSPPCSSSPGDWLYHNAICQLKLQPERLRFGHLEKLVVDELLRAAVPCDDDDRKIAYFVLHIFMTGQERAAGIGWR